MNPLQGWTVFLPGEILGSEFTSQLLDLPGRIRNGLRIAIINKKSILLIYLLTHLPEDRLRGIKPMLI